MRSVRCWDCGRKFMAKDEHDDWCDNCIKSHDAMVDYEFEEAICDGEAWALEDAPELWHPKYHKENV